MFKVECHFHSCLYSFTSMILVCFDHCRSFLLLSLIIISSNMFGCLGWTLNHPHFGLSKEPRASSMTFELRIPWRSHCRIMGGVQAAIRRDKRKLGRLLYRCQVVWLLARVCWFCDFVRRCQGWLFLFVFNVWVSWWGPYRHSNFFLFS